MIQTKGGGKDIPPWGIRLVALRITGVPADCSRDLEFMNFG
jgi:hypothetical protein